MAKSMGKPGNGKRFAAGVSAMTKKGMPKSEAGAIMAVEGRKKYGTKKMASWAAKGRAKAKA